VTSSSNFKFPSRYSVVLQISHIRLRATYKLRVRLGAYWRQMHSDIGVARIHSILPMHGPVPEAAEQKSRATSPPTSSITKRIGGAVKALAIPTLKSLPTTTQSLTRLLAAWIRLSLPSPSTPYSEQRIVQLHLSRHLSWTGGRNPSPRIVRSRPPTFLPLLVRPTPRNDGANCRGVGRHGPRLLRRPR